MLNTVKTITGIFILLLSVQLIQAQPYFRKISPDGGLTFRAIRTIEKDVYGIIWLATEHGLLRYDSKNFTSFNHIKNDSLTILNDNVTAIVTTPDSCLFVGTDIGLCQYDYKRNSFREHVLYNKQNQVIKSPHISSIDKESSGKIWLIADGELYYIDKGQSKKIDNSPTDLTEVFVDNNIAWLGNEHGEIFTINLFTYSITKFTQGKSKRIECLYRTDMQLVVGYYKGGAQKYNLNAELIKEYVYTNGKQWSIENANVRDIISDMDGNIWLATFKGLFIEKNEKLIRYSPETNTEIPHTSMYSFYREKQGAIWIGTWAGGLAYSHPSDNRITNYKHSENRGTLTNNVVSSFAQRKNGAIYIGTEVGGVNRFNKASSTFEPIQLLLEDDIAYNIKALATDKNDNLYIGTLKGLFVHKAGSNQFQHIHFGSKDGKHLSGNNVYSICATDTGVWLANFGDGINFYNPNTQTIHYLEDTYPQLNIRSIGFRHVIEASNKKLWFATNKGVIRIDLKNKTFKLFNSQNSSLRGDNILNLFESQSGEVWIGTQSHGLSIYNPKENTIINTPYLDVLNNKDVCSIIEDESNNIWICTDKGLYVYNQSNNKVRHFTKYDGLQSNLFNPQSNFRDQEGTLYFGGTNGFSTIDPLSLNTNTSPPDVIINNILINNKKKVNFYSLFDQDGQKHLQLKHSETSIRFDFSANNYLLPEKNLFKYRLKGLSDEWIDANNEGRAVFTNLSDGNYTFEAKACNNDGIWNQHPLQIQISIATPFWRSEWAFIIYFIALLVIIRLIYLFFRERENLKKQVLLEKIEKKNQEDMNEMKLRFFTNISHEFRTPLTLIAGPLKSLRESESFKGKPAEYLNIIDRNSNRLLNLVNQILDLRKVEKGKSILNVTSINVKAFIEERYSNFHQLAEENNIQYSFTFEGEDHLIMDADKEKLDKIIYNLISNAFKFTPENGTITIKAGLHPLSETHKYANQLRFGQVDTKQLINITVSDTGDGIQGGDLIRIFDRFEQGQNNAIGSGIGLALCQEYTYLHRGDITVKSSPSKGSSFQIRLPQKQLVQKMLTNEPEQLNSASLPSLSEPIVLEQEDKPVVLIVEDNADMQLFLDDLLSQDFQTVRASNGKEGLKVLKHHQIDLVLSDVMMPEMDGLEFCNHIKSNLATSHIPVILLTALTDRSNKLSGFDHGADIYISKPFDKELLIKQIKNIISHREKLRQKFGQAQLDNQQPQLGGLDNYFLNKINALIESNLTNEEFTVEFLAAEIGLSRSQLHRKLKSMTGSTTTEYIRTVKLKKAAELLKDGKYNIDEASYMSGFSSQSHFSKCFKELYKLSPKDYKAQYAN
ncbi:MAG: response regulator [Carboxylicivirga sp.]|jgi:signal transduction histidine kinase/DNA-binding response OmpR family regulator/streptogramin lyase|nr:response regulator [Carboxylicivirga sp.]